MIIWRNKMYLTNEEQAILDGERGEILQRNMRLLVRLGTIYGAEQMIPVESVQVAGVSYKSIGDPGLEFLQDFANNGAQVSVPTHLNPAGMDMEKWEEIGFPADFAAKQKEIINAFSSMGVNLTITCSPYLIDEIRPKIGQHIAWSESSAVSFANSVIGARTNREADLQHWQQPFAV
jgi:predicted aconitase